MKTKINKYSLCCLVCSVLTVSTFAQNIFVYEGNLKFLKDQTIINIQYDYSNMSVDDYKTEQEYLDDVIAKKNKRKPGTGNKWKEKWIEDREARFEPHFEELFNKYLNSDGVTVGDFPDAPFTIILHTYHTEIIGSIDTDIWFADTANMDNVKVKLTIKKITGQSPAKGWFGPMGPDFDSGYRLQESYAKCGKTLAKYLSKHAF